MGLFDNFPYTNFHELNLIWILQALKEIQTTTEQFVAINSLKYADPIQWNITSQYEKNTIVIDPQTGTAYISVQPVPSGVSLTNTDYWTVVFDLGSFVTRAAKNFTDRWEEATTLTATFPTLAGEWLVWGDTLYKATVNITAGDTYTPNGNIIRITIEEIKNEIYTHFTSLIGDLNDLDTTDKSNLVAAINEIIGKIGDLDDLDTTDKSNLVAAINEVASEVLGKIGDLDDLDTTDKSNLVAAINENTNRLNNNQSTIDSVIDSGLFYQNATRHGMSLQTCWTQEYNKKAISFAVHDNLLAVLFEDATLEVFNISVIPWLLQNTLSVSPSIIAIAIDSSYIYTLTSSTLTKYNYNLSVVGSISVSGYSRVRLWDDTLYLLKSISSSLDIYDTDLNLLDSRDYVGQHANTMFAISDNFAVFGLMGNRSNHVYNNNHPNRYEWVFTYPIYSNTQNPIPNTFDVCARSNSTFWILSNNVAAHNGVNLLTLSQYDLIFAWDGAQYDNTDTPIVNLTQYIDPASKNTIQKISGSRNTPYSDFDHAQDEIGLCPKLYSMLYASNSNHNFPELYLENIPIPIRVAIDSQHTGVPNFAGVYINNCNHVELSGIKVTGKVSEGYTGAVFIRNSTVLLDQVVIDKDDAPQHIQAREGSQVYCINCTPVAANMVTNTRLSTITQYPT